MTKRGLGRGAAWCTALCCLWWIVLHGLWERSEGIRFPDTHSIHFLLYAYACLDWLEALAAWGTSALAREPGPWPGLFPVTREYPPLTFLVSGVCMKLFGADLSVARAAQLPFLVGATAFCAALGGRVAGPRGAVLMALASVSSPWLHQYLRVYCQVPGQALCFAALLWMCMDPAVLRRPRACQAMGLIFAFGLLVSYQTLLLVLPLLLASFPFGSLKEREVRPLVYALLLLLGVVVAATALGIELIRADEGWDALCLRAVAQGLPPQEGELSRTGWTRGVSGVAALLVWASIAALWLQVGRRQARLADRPAYGLFQMAAVTGLVACPWYFLHLVEWSWLIGMQASYVPVGLHSPLARAWLPGLLVLDTAWWGGGVPWLVLGGLALAQWRGVAHPVRVLLGTTSMALALHLLLLIPLPRYLACLAPALAATSFLWAARWRSTYLVCASWLILASALQLGYDQGWLERLPVLGRVVEPRSISGVWGKVQEPLSADRLAALLGPGRWPCAERPSGRASFLDRPSEPRRLLFVWEDTPGCAEVLPTDTRGLDRVESLRGFVQTLLRHRGGLLQSPDETWSREDLPLQVIRAGLIWGGQPEGHGAPSREYRVDLGRVALRLVFE